LGQRHYWGHIFDHPDSNRPLITPAGGQLSVFELRSLMSLGKRAAAPAIELILHQIIDGMDGTPSWLLFDEFWFFLGDETSAEFLFDALRSIRKRGGAFVGATQSIAEIVNSPYCSLLLESAPGKLFFPNTELRSGDTYVREQYRRLGLPEHLITTIGSARSKHHFLYRGPEHSRLVALPLGDVAKKICGSTGWDSVRHFRQLLATHGNDRDAVLAAWLGD
jgi:type IV secretion system protein TrbE